MQRNLTVSVTAYNRTDALASTQAYTKWHAASGGPVRTLHIVNVPYDSTVYATHTALKMAVNELGEPYYYQPQAQLNDREIITKENRGCVIVNRTDDEIEHMLRHSLKRHVRLAPLPSLNVRVYATDLQSWPRRDRWKISPQARAR